MAEQENSEVTEAPKKSNKKIFIILALATLVVALVAGGVVWFVVSDSSEAPAEQVQGSSKAKAIYVNIRTSGGRPAFVTNFHSEEGKQRFLQVFVAAMVRDKEAEEALQAHMPLVVHRLNTLFGNQSLVELQTQDGKEALRRQATKEVQQVLVDEIGRPGVEQVFFTNFVMQ